METYLWNKHPGYSNLYKTEMDILSRGLGGIFQLSHIIDPDDVDERVIVLGTINYGVEQKQGIKIIFPSKYPNKMPKVIPGDIVVTGGKPDLKPRSFGVSNQYDDSSLCLIRDDSWHPYEHNIGWVLKRIKEWFEKATAPGGFKPADVVVERPAPFRHIGQVILPKKVNLPRSGRTGEFILTKFKENHYILADNMIDEFPFKNSLGTEIFRWYKFGDQQTFVKVFKTLDANNLFQVFKNQFGENIVSGSDWRNVALYFPGDKKQWHFLRLNIKRDSNSVKIEPYYYLTRIANEELYLRTKDLFDDQVLSRKRVTIVGLGAIGSEVAKSLARNGVGHFNLFDHDTFEIGNSVRHAADLFHIGETKTEVVKQLIKTSNPNITVNAYSINVLDDTGLLEKSLAESDLCLVFTAEDSVDYLLNDHYVQNYDFPFIFARVSPGALSGSVQIVDKDSACLKCLSAASMDTLPKPKTEVEFDRTSPEYGSCSTPAVPGSEIDTKEVALQATRITLQVLMAKKLKKYPELKGRQFYWHGPFGSKTHEPFSWEIRDFEKDKGCEICK